MFRIIRSDAKGCIDYRNKVYGLTVTWPNNLLSQIKIVIRLFRINSNGYRDLVYYRYRDSFAVRLLKVIFKPTPNLVLDVDNIASGGCFFHHPFSSYINAEHIGYHCSIRNNTTIGNKVVNGKVCRPYLEDDVFVGPNAVIIGDVRIGSHSVIGAGSVVTKDVPSYSVVAGNPAKILKFTE